MKLLAGMILSAGFHLSNTEAEFIGSLYQAALALMLFRLCCPVIQDPSAGALPSLFYPIMAMANRSGMALKIVLPITTFCALRDCKW
jgi:hypothetical protein